MRHVHDFNIKTLDVQFVHVIGNIFHVSFDLSIDITNVCKKIVSKLRLSNILQTIERNLYHARMRKTSYWTNLVFLQFAPIRTDPLSKPDAIQFLYILVSIYLYNRVHSPLRYHIVIIVLLSQKSSSPRFHRNGSLSPRGSVNNIGSADHRRVHVIRGGIFAGVRRADRPRSDPESNPVGCPWA